MTLYSKRKNAWKNLSEVLNESKDFASCFVMASASKGYDNLTRDVSDLVASSVWYSDIVQDANALDNFSLAAACVFIAGRLADQRIELRHIARVFPLTERSISDAYRVIYEEVDDLVNEEMEETLIGTNEREGDIWDRLPEPLEPRETRLQARLRREREMNDW